MKCKSNLAEEEFILARGSRVQSVMSGKPSRPAEEEGSWRLRIHRQEADRDEDSLSSSSHSAHDAANKMMSHTIKMGLPTSFN